VITNLAAMIKRRFIYISSLCVALLCINLSLMAQESSPADTVIISGNVDASLDSISASDINQAADASKSIADTIPPKRFLSGVELKIDYGKLLMAWTEFETKYEGGINIRFYERIVLVTEFGSAELNPLKAYDNALYYTINGMYGRVGLDYYMAYDPSNFFYVGLRYGMSNFEDNGAFLIDSDNWPGYQEEFGSENVTASWAEVVVGTETYLKVGSKAKTSGKSKLLLGWNARLRFLTDFENRQEPRIYAIPGYGRTFNNMTAALNFYIKYRIGS